MHPWKKAHLDLYTQEQLEEMKYTWMERPVLKKKLLIAQPRNGSEVGALVMAADAMGWDTFSAPMGWRLTEEMIASEQIGTPYGSQTFCEVISQQMGWTLKLNSFGWLATLPYECVARKVQFMTLGEAKELQETKFVKPADDKVFDAKIYEPGDLKKKVYRTVTAENEIAKLIDDSPDPVLPLDTPVLVSDVVKFVSEYRCFVRNQKVMTCSCYLMNGEINQQHNWPTNSKQVEEQLNYWLETKMIISEAAVIDLGFLSSGELVIIESNPAWASGIYGCDLAAVLEVLEVACGK